VAGDFYLDTATDTLYGPAVAASGGLTWGAGVRLMGPPGLNGTNGTGVLTSTIGTPPTNAVPGDYYIDVSHPNAPVLYGPAQLNNGSLTWPAGVPLVGTAGANGTAVLTSTTGSPPSNAVAGDYYIDVSNPNAPVLYGPAQLNNGSLTWPSGVPLVGPPGPTAGAAANASDASPVTLGAPPATGFTPPTSVVKASVTPTSTGTLMMTASVDFLNTASSGVESPQCGFAVNGQLLANGGMLYNTDVPYGSNRTVTYTGSMAANANTAYSVSLLCDANTANTVKADVAALDVWAVGN
jgi:hypothetical protein